MTTSTLSSSDVRESLLTAGRQAMAAKGYSAVGLKEILDVAGVPKGSFYHYFASKDAYGEALLDAYFADYLADVDDILSVPGLSMAQRLTNYWESWRANQSFADCQGRCLAVKLGAEIADLSPPMREAMLRGTGAIIGRIAAAIEVGKAEGSLHIQGTPHELAQSLYHLWLGSSILVKVSRTVAPFDSAILTTRRLLQIAS